MPSCTDAHQPLLTARQKTNRVAFAKKYSPWPTDKVRAIFWSDESTFTVSGIPLGCVRQQKNVRRDNLWNMFVKSYIQHLIDDRVVGTLS